MIAFEQYELYSYAAAIGSGVIVLVRGGYLYFKSQDQKLLNKYRIQSANLTKAEIQQYNQLKEQLTPSVEVFCKVPVKDTFPKKLISQTQCTGYFHFVICDKKSHRIELIAGQKSDDNTSKKSLCNLTGITFIEVTQPVAEAPAAFTDKAINTKVKRSRNTSPDPFSRRAKHRKHGPILKI